MIAATRFLLNAEELQDKALSWVARGCQRIDEMQRLLTFRTMFQDEENMDYPLDTKEEKDTSPGLAKRLHKSV